MPPASRPTSGTRPRPTTAPPGAPPSNSPPGPPTRRSPAPTPATSTATTTACRSSPARSSPPGPTAAAAARKRSGRCLSWSRKAHPHRAGRRPRGRRPGIPSLLRGQKRVDLFLQILRLRAVDDVQHLDLVVLDPAREHVGRSAGDAEAVSQSDAVADLSLVAPAGEALLEGGDVQLERLGISWKLVRSQSTLILEQQVMHLPEFLLIACARGRLRRLESVRMHL